MRMTLTEDRRRTYWKTIDRLQSRTIDRMAGLVMTQLVLDKNRVATAISKVSPDNASETVSIVLDRAIEEWVKLYNRIYFLTMTVFATRVLEQFEKAFWTGEQKQASPQDLERWEQIASRYVANTASGRIPGLISNTNKQIQGAIAAGIGEGLGSAEIARSIRKLDTGFNRARALRVARTEVIAGSNLGTLEGGRTVDSEMRKEWIATPDDRTRETHIAADGQLRNIDDPFEVGGFQMMFPGDTSLGAPPSETINERCTIGFVPAERRELVGSG